VIGPAVGEYESEFARVLGVRHALSFSAARVGLYGLLRSLGVGQGDEVLVPVPTHVVIANAVRYTGATPVFVDCELDTYNVDLEQADKKATPRAKVLILQHTFGIPADLEGALALAETRGLEVIEDCVHALGATYRGRQVGTFGRAAIFSTEETKIISSTMGGMVVTDDSGLAAQMEAFRADCAKPSAALTARYLAKFILYYLVTEPRIHRVARSAYERAGRRNPLPEPTSSEESQGLRPAVYEQLLSNAQAGLALRQLRRLDANLAHRRSIARTYRALLVNAGVKVPDAPRETDPAFVRFPVWATDREAAIRSAAPRAVLGTWFTSVLEEALTPAHGGYAPGSCPRAEEAAVHLINLPTHARVTEEDAEAIASAVAKAERSAASRRR
jgi:perosamine synthetase